MKRLYYLTNSIDAAESLSNRLHEEGMSDWDFHVLGKDKANIVRHHLHATTPIHELDIIRSGERGVLIGFVIGAVLTAYLAFFTPFGGQVHFIWQLAGVAVLSLFGAWVGGLVGANNENYKIKKFHDDIEKGSYLLLVDVKRDEQERIKSIIAGFPSIRKAGEGSTINNPFDVEAGA